MATASGKASPAPASAPGAKDTKPKPEKPNEEEYQKALAVAEKALVVVQERFVSSHSTLLGVDYSVLLGFTAGVIANGDIEFVPFLTLDDILYICPRS